MPLLPTLCVCKKMSIKERKWQFSQNLDLNPTYGIQLYDIISSKPGINQS